MFSSTHIGVQDGWSVGNGPDVYRPQHGYDESMEFHVGTPYENDDLEGSLPNSIPVRSENPCPTSNTNHPLPSGVSPPTNQRNKRKRATSNDDNLSDLSIVFRERSEAIKLAAGEMSSALTSDVTMASRRILQIPEIEFGSSFYWDVTKLLSTDETARKWLLGISENEFALRYLEQIIGRKHNE